MCGRPAAAVSTVSAWPPAAITECGLLPGHLKYAGLDCVIYIPRRIIPGAARRCGSWEPKYLRSKADYEDAVALLKSTPGASNITTPTRAATIPVFSSKPTVRSPTKSTTNCATPQSCGGSRFQWNRLAGVYKGFLSLYRRGKTSRMPIMVAGSSAHKNPSFLLFQGKDHCIELEPGSIKETEINEPLINWHSFDGDHALRALYKTNGWAAMLPTAPCCCLLNCSKIKIFQMCCRQLPPAIAGELLENDRQFVVI